ncbi:hypothetical protein Goarm_017459 [Gossypium armourianum]|uniref:Uncharacterized protein n=1 Tax=Gossypium armourianum TaxID=34283 RepID=A0A7J9JG90_9ROSI|nr:hypothetical protein [Gossypium armourianum]
MIINNHVLTLSRQKRLHASRQFKWSLIWVTGMC